MICQKKLCQELSRVVKAVVVFGTIPIKLTGEQAGIGLQRENFGISDIQKVETLILVILGV